MFPKSRWLGVIAVLFLSFSGFSAQAQTLDSQELAFVSLINNYRAQNGAGALQVSIALEDSSQWMANDLATKNYFSHTDSLGRTPGQRFAAFGYPYSTWGEDIAAGYNDAQDTLNQWITACDPDGSGNCTYAHRQIMLNPAYVVMGIARAYSATSTYGWYWVADFGGALDPTLNLGSGSSSDKQPPTAPLITSATARSATEVDLTWSASSDNVGVTGYQITRNGVVLTSVSGSTLSYADTTVSGGSTYSYSVKAFDAAGNYSTASNTVQVTTPAALTGISVASVSPKSSTAASQNVAFTISGKAGYGDISFVEIDIAKTLTAANACLIYFMPAYNMVWLANNAGTAWTGPDTLGSTATLQNSQCSINVAGSKFTGSGTNLTLNLALTGTAAGSNNIYVYAADNSGLATNWQTAATWTEK